MRIDVTMGYSYAFMWCDLEDFVSERVKIIGTTMLRVEQRVRRNSQWDKATYYLGWIISERESKLKSPWIKQDEFVKGTESDQRIYFLRFCFRLGPKTMLDP